MESRALAAYMRRQWRHRERPHLYANVMSSRAAGSQMLPWPRQAVAAVAKRESAIKACPSCHSQWAPEWRLKPEQAVLIVQRADVEHRKDMPDHHARYS